jgi:ABC-2 type transport system permease protein
MRLDTTRVAAVIRKEMRTYRRNRTVVVTMAILPIFFLIEPVVTVFLSPPTGSGSTLSHELVLPLLYLLLISVIIPSTLAAYAIVGEREQGTLEPLLTTPIRQQEFIVGKAAAVLLPAVIVAYVVIAVFLVAVALFAKTYVSSAVFHDGPVLLAQALFTPLLAGWATVVGMGISARSSDVRVAQQLGTLASLPPVSVIVLLSIGTIKPTFVTALLLALALFALDVAALRLVSKVFDRERLVTGARADRA